VGEERTVYRVLVGKPEGKRPLEKPRRRWEDGIKMDLREFGREGCWVDSPGSGYGSLAGCCDCDDELSGSGATELLSLRGTFQKYPLLYPIYQAYCNILLITGTEGQVLMSVIEKRTTCC
jgi:hypothetical protein